MWRSRSHCKFVEADATRTALVAQVSSSEESKTRSSALPVHRFSKNNLCEQASVTTLHFSSCQHPDCSGCGRPDYMFEYLPTNKGKINWTAVAAASRLGSVVGGGAWLVSGAAPPPPPPPPDRGNICRCSLQIVSPKVQVHLISLRPQESQLSASCRERSCFCCKGTSSACSLGVGVHSSSTRCFVSPLPST